MDILSVRTSFDGETKALKRRVSKIIFPEDIFQKNEILDPQPIDINFKSNKTFLFWLPVWLLSKPNQVVLGYYQAWFTDSCCIYKQSYHNGRHDN